MKGKYLVIVFTLLLFKLAYAGSVGITPAYYEEHFEEFLEKDFKFRAFGSVPEARIEVTLGGDLKEYATLSKSIVDGTEEFTVHLSLPAQIDKPGINKLYVIVKEYLNQSEITGTVGSIPEIRAPIKIQVPYPGLYVEAEFQVNDQNENENTKYELEIKNLGTQSSTITPKIEVFKNDENGERIIEKDLEEITLLTKESTKIQKELETKDLLAGDYFVKVSLPYGPEGRVIYLNDTFRIGKFLVEILDYDYEFEEGGIKPFNITIENRWNEKISAVYADVLITEEGRTVQTFKTLSVDTDPWEIKSLLGYFDTTGMNKTRHLANIKVNYGNAKTQKLVAIYITEKQGETDYTIYIILGSVILGVVIILTVIYLILKVRKLNKALKRDGKKKK